MQVKICGITSPHIAQFCCDIGVDFVGVVFVKKSPRYIVPAQAKNICNICKNTNTKTVGLFQDHTVQDILNVLYTADVDMIQLHGDETVDFIHTLKTHTKKPIIKAFGISQLTDFAQAQPYDSICQYLLFDAKPPKQADIQGGHGVRFDWDMLNHMPSFQTPWFLAGGLTPKNVNDAIKNPNVKMLDVSGGVEKTKGVKDIQKIQAFIKTCK